MHDLRIVNARGHQEWNGHNRYDEAHPTLPVWRDYALTTIPLASTLIRYVHRKKPRVAGRTQFVSPRGDRELERHGAKTAGAFFS